METQKSIGSVPGTTASFYTIDATRIPGFEGILEQSRLLSRIPEGYHPDHFHKQLDDPEYARNRDEVYHLPDTRAMLEREAREHFENRLPGLKKTLFNKPFKPQQRKSPIKECDGYLAIVSEKHIAPLRQAVEGFFGGPCTRVGDFWYPAGGYRSWHTNNYDVHGWEMFLVDVDVPQGSYFQYIDPATGAWVKVPDKPGMINIFKVDPKNHFWHSIVSENANRWSQGFRIPDNWIERLL